MSNETHLSLFMTQLLKFLQAGGGAAIGYSQEQKAVEINFVLGDKFQNVTVTLFAVLSNHQSIIQAAFIALCRLNGEVPETKARSVEDYRAYCKAKQEEREAMYNDATNRR